MIDIGKDLKQAYEDGYQDRDAEIVRCKDCIHQTYCHQTVANTEVHADFKEYWSVKIEWCSRGKRKGGNDD